MGERVRPLSGRAGLPATETDDSTDVQSSRLQAGTDDRSSAKQDGDLQASPPQSPRMVSQEGRSADALPAPTPGDLPDAGHTEPDFVVKPHREGDSSLFGLPDEASGLILSGLPASDLARLSLTSTGARARFATFLGAEISRRDRYRYYMQQAGAQETKLAWSANALGAAWHISEAKGVKTAAWLRQMTHVRLPLTHENKPCWTAMLKEMAPGTWRVLEIDLSGDIYLGSLDELVAAMACLEQAGKEGREIRFCLNCDALDRQRTIEIAALLSSCPWIGKCTINAVTSSDPDFRLLGQASTWASHIDLFCKSRSGTHTSGNWGNWPTPTQVALSLDSLCLTSKNFLELQGSLHKAQALTTLKLQSTFGFDRTGSNFFVHCPSLPALQEVDFSRNYLDGEAGTALAEWLEKQGKTLTKVSLRDSQLDEACAPALARALEKHPLEQLDLGFNRFGVGGSHALLSACASWPGLRCLDLSGTRHDSASCSMLCELLLRSGVLEELVLRQLEFVVPDETVGLWEAVLDAARKNRSLRCLDLAFAPVLTDQGGGARLVAALANLLAHHVRLDDLRLSGLALEGAHGTALVSALARNDSLSSLALTRCRLDYQTVSAFAAVLAAHQGLGSVRMSDNNLDTVVMLPLLEGMLGNAGINVIDLSGNHLSLQCLQTLVDLIPQRRQPLLLTFKLNLFEAHVQRNAIGFIAHPDDLQSGLNTAFKSLCQAVLANPLITVPGLFPWMPSPGSTTGIKKSRHARFSAMD